MRPFDAGIKTTCQVFSQVGGKSSIDEVWIGEASLMRTSDLDSFSCALLFMCHNVVPIVGQNRIIILIFDTSYPSHDRDLKTPYLLHGSNPTILLVTNHGRGGLSPSTGERIFNVLRMGSTTHVQRLRKCSRIFWFLGNQVLGGCCDNGSFPTNSEAS